MEVSTELLDQLAQSLYWNLWTLKEIRKEIIRWRDVSGAKGFARFYLDWGDPDEALKMSQSALEALREDHRAYWVTHPDKSIRNMVLRFNHLEDEA